MTVKNTFEALSSWFRSRIYWF